MNNAPAVSHIGVGIDTARYGHHVSFLDDQKRTAAQSFHFTETAAGYQQLQQAFERLAAKHPQLHLHIHVDVAGRYAENLLQWLQQHASSATISATISVGQPARNKAYRQVHFAKRKADPVESLACARFAIVERPAATPPNPPEFRQLREVVALREAASKQQTRLINQLHGLLARVFPELAVHVKDLSASWVLTLLERYPTPEKLARARRQSLVRIPHLSEQRAVLLQAAAAQSLGSQQGSLAEQLVRQKVRAIRQQQEEADALNQLIQQAWDALPAGPHGRIATIPGIGLQTSAALVAKIVSLDRFPTASAVIGYFGIFPEEVDVSGTDRQGRPKQGREMHMSCKGNDLVRRLLYTAAQSAVTWNPPVQALFTRLRAADKEYNVALGHCMAKLLRQVFAVWSKDCDFDPHFESRQHAEQAAATPVQLDAEETKEAAGHNAVEPLRKVVTTTSSSNITSTADPRQFQPLNFARLREMVSIAQVLEHFGWQPRKKQGVQWRGDCPIHQEVDAKRPSFAVQTKKNAYCCHRCGSQGNALDLWVALCGKPILEASWQMVEALDLEPPLL